MMKPQHTRSVLIDGLKAVAIILVIVGHAMQFGSGMHSYVYSVFFDNAVFKVIYGFHMPLFMLISGYLFWHSMQRHSFKENAVSRVTSLLVPVMLWSIIPYIIRIASGEEHGVLMIIRAYFTTCMGNFWFLWAVLLSSVIVMLVSRFCGDNASIYIILAVLMLCTPDFSRLHLYKFMYGYFVVGYMWAKGQHSQAAGPDSLRAVKPYKIAAALIATGAVYLLMLPLYEKDCYIYTTGFSLLGKDYIIQLVIDVFRFIIGMAGSSAVILFAMLLRCMYRNVDFLRKICGQLINFLSYVGKNTLGIYLISTLIFEYIIKPLAWGLYGIDYTMILIQSAAVLLLSLAIIWLVRRIPVVGRWLLGGR